MDETRPKKLRQCALRVWASMICLVRCVVVDPRRQIDTAFGLTLLLGCEGFVDVADGAVIVGDLIKFLQRLNSDPSPKNVFAIQKTYFFFVLLVLRRRQAHDKSSQLLCLLRWEYCLCIHSSPVFVGFHLRGLSPQYFRSSFF